MRNIPRFLVKAFFNTAVYGALMITLPAGCKKASITDQINADLESATTIASMEKRRSAWNQAIQKHFPLGMDEKKANALLMVLKDEGFLVRAYEADGFKNWPDGALTPHPKEMGEQAKQELAGKQKIVAVKRWASRIIVEEYLSITLVFSKTTRTIIESRAHRSSTLL
jgi:hypothetical protein